MFALIVALALFVPPLPPTPPLAMSATANASECAPGDIFTVTLVLESPIPVKAQLQHTAPDAFTLDTVLATSGNAALDGQTLHWSGTVDEPVTLLLTYRVQSAVPMDAGSYTLHYDAQHAVADVTINVTSGNWHWLYSPIMS